MPITLSETQHKVYTIAEQTKDMGTKLKLNNLSMELIEAKSYQRMHCDHSWDIPSMIVGGLFATAAALLIFPSTVCADSLDINLTSWHSDNSIDYNSNNIGLGYTRDINHHWQWKVGGYKNSYNKNSLYAMMNLKHDMANWRWGVQFGFLSGYDDIESMQSENSNGQKTAAHTRHESDEHEHSIPKARVDSRSNSTAKNRDAIIFAILPTVTWKINRKHALQFGYVPAYSKEVFAFATLQYQYTLGK